MIRRILALSALLLGGAGGGRLVAQSGAVLIDQGIAAYRALEFEAAASLIRRGLAAGSSARVGRERSDAWLYLGASELLRGRRDHAEEAFQQALANEPRFRPDSLVFPPQVTDVFDEVRRQSGYVKVRAPRDTTIAYGIEHYVFHLFASARHDATVELAGQDGRGVRKLYAGPLPDSMEVRWEGLDGAGRAPLTGSVNLVVTSRPVRGPARVVRVPLTVRPIRRDTLPLPPQPVLAPVRSDGPSARALGTLGLGLFAGLAAVMLPELVASEGAGGSARYYIGGGLAVAGVAGFMAQQSRTRSAEASAREEAKEAWSRRVDSVQAENTRLRRDLKLRITSGVQSVAARGGGEGQP